jgi:hypothetical protein
MSVVIAIFSTAWRLDLVSRHLIPSAEIPISTFFPSKLDPDSVIRITNNYRTAKGLAPREREWCSWTQRCLFYCLF